MSIINTIVCVMWSRRWLDDHVKELNEVVCVTVCEVFILRGLGEDSDLQFPASVLLQLQLMSALYRITFQAISQAQTILKCWNKITRVLLELWHTPIILIVCCKVVIAEKITLLGLVLNLTLKALSYNIIPMCFTSKCSEQSGPIWTSALCKDTIWL